MLDKNEKEVAEYIDHAARKKIEQLLGSTDVIGDVEITSFEASLVMDEV
jgi:hypothetical protein